MRIFGYPLLGLITALGAACGGDDGPAGDADAGPIEFDGGADPDAGPDCSGLTSEAPATRGEMSGVLDAERGRIVVYGGNTAAPEMCMPRYNLVDEMWAFHLDCALWERLSPAPSPGVRARHASVLDGAGGRMLIFGGRDRVGFGEYTNFADVWAYDLATDRWTEIETTGGPPPARSSSAVAHDAANDRLLMFGGNTSTSGLTLTGIADLWQLDLATGEWTELTPADGPSARLFHSSVVMGHEWIVFGGTPSFDGPYHDDVWAFDMTTDTWRRVAAGGGGPVSRFGAEAYADPERNRVIVFGGHDGTAMGNRNDVWAVDVTSGEWTELRPGDVLNGGAAGFCDFPADFTTPEEGAPERRYSFLQTQDARRGYLFGGKTDCGNTNDVWAMELSTGAWTQLRTATGGIACNRSGSLTCTSLCF